MPERIDLLQADDFRDVVHRAVACLAGGGVVGMASYSGYGLLASAVNPAAIARIGLGLDPPAGAVAAPAIRPATLLLKSPGEFADWVDLALIPAAPRLIRRAWPGPIVFQLRPAPTGLTGRLPAATRAAVEAEGWLALRSPAGSVMREILRLAPGPLVEIAAVSANAGPTPRSLLRPDDLTRFDGLDLLIDSGEPVPGHDPTILALTAAGWSIVQPGAISERQIEQWSSVIILFVCTGNTCRSPMAEALCKVVLARRIGCPVDDLPQHGYLVLSAGVAATEGMPAAVNAAEVVQGRGGSLADHSSQQITTELVRHADHILAMTWDHLDAVLDEAPDAGHRVRLLDPAGGDIPDPVGLDLPTYRETAREIERHLEHLLGELGL